MALIQASSLPLGEHRPGESERKPRGRDPLGREGPPGPLPGRVPVPVQPALRPEIHAATPADGGSENSGHAAANPGTGMDGANLTATRFMSIY